MRDPNAMDQANAFARPSQSGAPDWWMAASKPLTPATAATGQTAAGQASAMRGIGGEGWNEDFDEAWANRMMKIYGVSMEDLRDPGTRRSLNRQQREARTPTGLPPEMSGLQPVPSMPPGTEGIQPVTEPPPAEKKKGPAGSPSSVYF